eukprot:TRINITY_DN2978_c0_g1_i1.p2 TRINITY_DN2978_c0_g1~~TRINITY_DN2978_c0_g1_i1.p2  ORF type:complete len:101 (+),score=23.76 TRINITY_DN2978_c0_g1_i1:247-549(+)
MSTTSCEARANLCEAEIKALWAKLSDLEKAGATKAAKEQLVGELRFLRYQIEQDSLRMSSSAENNSSSSEEVKRLQLENDKLKYQVEHLKRHLPKPEVKA